MVMTQEIAEGIQGIQVHIKDTTVGEPYGTEEDIEESMNLILTLKMIHRFIFRALALSFATQSINHWR